MKKQKNVPEWQIARKNEIKRNLIIIASYINMVLGFLECLIAIYINHDGQLNDDNVYLYALLGVILMTVGIGGIKYEEILRDRELSKKRSTLQRNDKKLY